MDKEQPKDQDKQENNQSSTKNSGENFVKAQHKNEQDWARQSRKGSNAMGGIKSDSQGNPIDNKQEGQK